MRIVLAVHGYPPELAGGTEHSVQALARGLAGAGHHVAVIAGTNHYEQGFRTSATTDRDPASGASFPVHRIHRGDLYFGHWQKSRSTRASLAFAALLEQLRPDVLHVHHWLRLSSDLVARAAAARVPAVVTLHDLWTTCLVTFRIRPDTQSFCEASLAPDPCLACVAHVPPRTPWRTSRELELELQRHRADLQRELRLARIVTALCRDQAETLSRLGPWPSGTAPAIHVLPPGRDLSLPPAVPLASPSGLRRLIVGSWGGLHWLKGTDLLIEALSRLQREGGPVVELHLAGSEAETSVVAKLRAAAAGLRVTFHGPFGAGGLPGHPVTAVHAMVNATRAHETWGLVLDEAIALRLPMVLPRAGAFPEHVGEHRGALFYPPGDAGALAASLARLATEPDLLATLRAQLPPLHSVLPSLREHADAVLACYAAACSQGPPDAPAFAAEQDAQASRAEAAWDVELSHRSAEELGLA